MCFLAVLFLINACGENESTPAADSPVINIHDALASNPAAKNTKSFEHAVKERFFSFPDDHGMHPGYRNEWWYFTGNLSDDQGRRFGYQLTFFRVGLRPATSDKIDTDKQNSKHAASAWKTQNIWMAHAAISDGDQQQHYSSERFSRGNPGLAGAQLKPFKVWLDNWHVNSKNSRKSLFFPWHLQMNGDNFNLQLSLIPMKPIVLQGDGGLSQKSTTPGNASYYYSMPRLATKGNLSINNQHFTVEGLSWMDREWGTSSLDDDQIGWNWFSLQFHSGEDIMYYQLLDNEGLPDAASQGKWIGKQGELKTISATQMKLTPQSWWESKNGVKWPISWRMDYLPTDKSWIIKPLIKDQLMELSVIYWEGAVEIIDNVSGNNVGYGYLEMTRSKKKVTN
jgi:predicted secreted hydrolase